MTIFSVSEYLMGDLQPAVLEETKTKVGIEIMVLFELMLYIQVKKISVISRCLPWLNQASRL